MFIIVALILVTLFIGAAWADKSSEFRRSKWITD
jgi:hypothetical protein